MLPEALRVAVERSKEKRKQGRKDKWCKGRDDLLSLKKAENGKSCSKQDTGINEGGNS